LKESEKSDSDKLDELAELLRRLDKRRGLSVQQVLGLLVGSLILVFLVGPIAVLFLGTIIRPIFASVFIAMFVMFIFEDMRSSNILKRTGLEKEEEEIEGEEQESLDEFEEKTGNEL
jgi:Flp pilus assembly protein TadB